MTSFFIEKPGCVKTETTTIASKFQNYASTLHRCPKLEPTPMSKVTLNSDLMQ